MTTRKQDRRKRLALRIKLAGATPLPVIGAQTTRDILAAEAHEPLRGGAADMPNKSLFGDAHKQRNLF